MSARGHEVQAPDGRVLRVHEAGDPSGRAVVFHHGTPADGRPFGPWAEDADARGVRLIGYDRPGYGGSVPHPGRSVGDAAADVAAIADALGVDRFATWGESGGGPHTLACAALLGDRCVAAACLAGVAPFDAEGLNYLRGMGDDNWAEFGAALAGPFALEPYLQAQVDEMREASPGDLADLMRSLVSAADQQALDAGFAEHWAGTFGTVFAQGFTGWADDDYAFTRPFGFDVGEIAVPVSIWHGHQDRFVPVAHGEWLAARIPGAEARISEQDGHFSVIVDRIGEVHAWLVARF